MGIEEEWREMKKVIKGALKEVEEEQKKEKKRRREWWDEECREKKKEVREELRKGRRTKGKKEIFIEKKKEY